MSPRLARILSLARLALGVGLVVLLLAILDVRELGRTLASAKLGLVTLALALSMSNAFLASLRWAILLQARGRPIPLGRLVRIYFVSGFLSNFLPSSLATDGLRIFYARGYADLETLVSSMAVDRLVGFFAMAVVALATFAALPFVGVLTLGPGLSAALVGFSLLAIAAPALAFHPAVARGVRALLAPWREVRLVARLEGAFDAFVAYRDHPGALARVTGVAFLSTLRGILLFWLVALALSAGGVSILYFFLLIPIMSVVESIPVSLAGLGVHEGAIVLYFAQVGVPAEVSAGIAIVVRGLSLLGTLPGAAFYFSDRETLRPALARKEAP